jgi:hypothetical protein
MPVLSVAPSGRKAELITIKGRHAKVNEHAEAERLPSLQCLQRKALSARLTPII